MFYCQVLAVSSNLNLVRKVGSLHEPRNFRLALLADGINPYSDMSSKYSYWPVVMVIYNLSPMVMYETKVHDVINFDFGSKATRR